MGTCKCGQSEISAVLTLAIATVPLQPWDNPYPPEKALQRGTVFPNLDLPFYAGGEKHG